MEELKKELISVATQLVSHVRTNTDAAHAVRELVTALVMIENSERESK